MTFTPGFLQATPGAPFVATRSGGPTVLSLPPGRGKVRMGVESAVASPARCAGRVASSTTGFGPGASFVGSRPPPRPSATAPCLALDCLLQAQFSALAPSVALPPRSLGSYHLRPVGVPDASMQSSPCDRDGVLCGAVDEALGKNVVPRQREEYQHPQILPKTPILSRAHPLLEVTAVGRVLPLTRREVSGRGQTRPVGNPGPDG